MVTVRPEPTFQVPSHLVYASLPGSSPGSSPGSEPLPWVSCVALNGKLYGVPLSKVQALELSRPFKFIPVSGKVPPAPCRDRSGPAVTVNSPSPVMATLQTV